MFVWSLIKVILFVLLVMALAWGASYLLEAPGSAVLTGFGREVTLGPLQIVIAMILLVLAVWLLLKLLGFLAAFARYVNGDDTALTRHFGRRRERRGFEALAEGMMALASGEGRVAMEKAARAESKLHRPELTQLLTAQGAEMAGDRKRAEASYRALLTDERTRFVGVRGLMKQRLAQGDTETALKLAERAYALRPRHEETQDTLLRLQTQRGDWAAARRTLQGKLKSGTLPRDVHRRRDAVLALSEATGTFSTASDEDARQAAIEANRLSPDLVPAAVAAARAHMAQGKPKYAARVLRKAWDSHPHPDLAAAFAAIAPDETPAQRIRRFRALTEVRPQDPETRMLSAELALAAEDFPAARRALGDLATTHPTARSLTLMAAIERGEGADDAVVRAWLARAVTAPRGPQWVCDNCHNIHGQWGPVCDNCGAFDSLAWTEPPRAEIQLPGTGMLPLIAGEPRAQEAGVPAVAEPRAPRPEPPRPDPPRAAPPRSEPPRSEPPRPDTSRPDAPRPTQRRPERSDPSGPDGGPGAEEADVVVVRDAPWKGRTAG